ncbi:MAG: tRNA (N(6)-L-threonylcarbamoyladenosine(37)-C(2))-methylthiotransferase MtaB [Eubacteriales bacterium]|nr:tRNA (N(6)-L-threonylcarbamoyladenosine(37)-C(2))-methylthiotransferase MtaB [Eubacteriales bacterium]
MNKTVAFHTLGCKVNRYETEALTQLFKERGYEIVDFNEPADVYVINTCTVTGMSDRKSRNAVRKARRQNSDSVVVVTGCYPQTAPEEVAKIEGVDIITGTANKAGILDLIDELQLGGARKSCDANSRISGSARILRVDEIMRNRSFEEMKVSSFGERTRAFVKIQDGCNRFCTYCIIPYARGPIRSRDPQNIAEEIERLASEGFSEVVLTGIHIASYGLDLRGEAGGIGLMDIVEKAHDIPGVERIRLGSLEPVIITDDFISRARKLNKLCPHYHISLQSGCNATLKRMNRRYTTEQYRAVCEALKANVEDVSITTDIMVGFPGETDEEFEQTYSYLTEIPLTQMHVFKYSRRKGTPAAEYEGQVDPYVKEERSKRLLSLSAAKTLEFNKRFIGRRMRVLFEQEVENMPGFVEGRSDNYIRVISEGDSSLHGKSMQVLLKYAKDDFVIGEI